VEGAVRSKVCRLFAYVLGLCRQLASFVSGRATRFAGMAAHAWYEVELARTQMHIYKYGVLYNELGLVLGLTLSTHRLRGVLDVPGTPSPATAAADFWITLLLSSPLSSVFAPDWLSL
jgi:hypothetical protein